MFFLQFLTYYLIFRGSWAEIISDVTIEKLYIQFNGAVQYMFGNDESLLARNYITFNLYTRQNPQIAQIIPPNYPALLPLSYFNPRLKSYFIIHGYTDHKHREIIARLRLELNRAEDVNVIVVDWSGLAGLIYFKAVSYTPDVGNYVGEFLSVLENSSIDLENVHLIGHSLGAHISGIAGAFVGGRVGRITGLDPAGPLFELLEERDQSISLDKSDAKFVDVIHTDADEFGITKPIGHADFYPNEGTSPQPGCTNALTVVSCSHIRSVEFYTESVIDAVPFEARHCNITHANDPCVFENPVRMGHHLSRDAGGIYFLKTNSDSPFAKTSYKRHSSFL